MKKNIRKRWQLINKLIQENNYRSYLEIGIRRGDCFDRVVCERKTGVDPNGNRATHKMTSDRFFDQSNETFDIVFIDGLHLAEQLYRDITNALKVLNEGGSIVVHDLNPRNETAQKREKLQSCWTGDCWKAWVWLRQERNDLNMKVIDIDRGCGMIRRGEQVPLQITQPLEYKFLEKNRCQWLNLVENDETIIVGGNKDGQFENDYLRRVSCT